METQTETLTTTTAGQDVAVIKTERFDVDFARFILENKDVSADERAAVRRLYKNRRDGNKHETRYKLGKDIKHEDAGRLHAVHAEGLQCLSRDCRSALAQKFYWDVDMRNAQPVLLEQLARKHGWACPHLTHYNAEREDFISELMEACGIERWEAKEKVCRLMFGGSAMGMTAFFVNELQPEVGTLMRNVYKEYAKVYPFAAKRGERSLMAMVLQTIERKCLLAMDLSLTKQGRSLDVYIHDGGLVLKKDGETRLPDSILRQAEADIQASEGYTVSLAVKELKTTLERPDEDAEDALLPPNVLVDDRYAAMRFVELMGDLFVMDAGHLWVFNPETGMWSEERSVLERVITGLNGKLVFRQMGAMGVKVYDYSGCVEKRNSLIKMLPSVARVQDGYFRSRLSSDKGKLLFKDGIYDFAKREFTAGFDPQVIFHASCPRKFPGTKEMEKIAFVHKVLFEEPFKDPKEAARLRHNLMRAMIGDWRRKTFVVALGPKNSSKSTLIFAAKTMFGSYVGEFDANSMLIRHGGEAARDLLWVSDLYFCRFAFSSEIKQDEKATLAIDGNMLKKLVSGGTDTISFRKMCVNDADKVFFRPTLFILANDLPKITPCSEEINDRLQVVDYHYSFQSKPTELHHKPLDREIGTKMAQDDYADAFFWVLTREYEEWEAAGFPELPPCETELQEDLMEQANVKNILLGRYVLTGNTDDQVDAKEVQTYVRQGGFIGSETRVTREMKQLGLGTARVWRGRQRVKVYTGLKVEELV